MAGITKSCEVTKTGSKMLINYHHHKQLHSGRVSMKNMIVLIAFGILALTVGCATSTYTFGRDFPGESANQITKGKTTSADLVKIFGEPFSKNVISATEEKWVYSYGSSTSSAQSYVITMKVKTTGQQKTLDVLLKNGVVVNYVFNEGPMIMGNTN
jgi:hypothetical protein